MSLLWSVGVFSQDPDFNIVKYPLDNLIKVFDAKRIRKSDRHIHSYADPFLFVHNSDLFLFSEIQEIGGKGYIHSWKTDNLIEWESLGPVLKKNNHLSYPFVFCDKKSNDIYLLPESGESKKTFLYKFQNFPYNLTQENLILTGNYADSSVLEHNGIYYLTTTHIDTDELQLYYTENLSNSSWTLHPNSPISMDKKLNRNGGGLMKFNNRIYRIAQDTETQYGKGIIILEVQQLTVNEYSEMVINPDFKPLANYSWQKLGRHHLSFVHFQGRIVAAIDGLQSDLLINKFINLLHKIF